MISYDVAVRCADVGVVPTPRATETFHYIFPSQGLQHCVALNFTAFHCIALHCIALHCIALHCIALHCIALHCIALHCIALHCVALQCRSLLGGVSSFLRQMSQQQTSLAWHTPKNEKTQLDEINTWYVPTTSALRTIPPSGPQRGRAFAGRPAAGVADKLRSLTLHSPTISRVFFFLGEQLLLCLMQALKHVEHPHLLHDARPAQSLCITRRRKAKKLQRHLRGCMYVGDRRHKIPSSLVSQRIVYLLFFVGQAVTAARDAAR